MRGVRSAVYSLDGSPIAGYEGLILRHDGEWWLIEYSERGIRQELTRTMNEGDACDRMLELSIKSFVY